MDERLNVVYREIAEHYTKCSANLGSLVAAKSALVESTPASADSCEPAPQSVHVDIGSDHGLLLQMLLREAIVSFGIAVENKPAPLRNSQQALQGLNADVRLGDGLSVVQPGECTSLSICGMGGELMVQILERHPERIPKCVVLQPNNHPELVRSWALGAGYLLESETLTEKLFLILRFKRSGRGDAEFREDKDGGLEDPAYPMRERGLDFQAALHFGPLLIKRNDERLFKRLREEQVYWSTKPTLSAETRQRLRLIQSLLNP